MIFTSRWRFAAFVVGVGLFVVGSLIRVADSLPHVVAVAALSLALFGILGALIREEWKL